MSYGPSLPERHRRAATYVAKIFTGANPADLAVEQSTKFELIINLKTAKALGPTVPPVAPLPGGRGDPIDACRGTVRGIGVRKNTPGCDEVWGRSSNHGVRDDGGYAPLHRRA